MRDASEVIAACPFCGGAPAIGPWKDAIDQSDTAPTAIECSSGLDDCPVNPAVSRWTREEAIAAWNRRPTTSTPPGDACVRHACKRVRMEMQARIDALSQRAEVGGWQDLLDVALLIVVGAMPATASGATCFVPRYQIDKLENALAAIKGDSHAQA